MLDKLKEMLSPIAPVLGGMLGGPLGAAAGLAVKKLLTGNDNASDDELLQALQNLTPEQKLAIQKLDNDFNLEMEKLALEQYQIDANDRANARSMHIANYDWVTTLLAVGFLAIYAIIQLYAIYSPGNQDDIISARVQDIIVMIVSFYFGSSSSARKNEK